MHLRCQALVSHDLHSTVKGAFILVCFQTLRREWQTGLWRMNVRRMQLDKILPSGGAGSSLNLLLVTSSTPAFWSWWRREECFQTRWRRRRSLRRCRSARGWWLCRGCHLMEAGASLQEVSWQTVGCGGGGRPLRPLFLSEWFHTDLCTSSSGRSSHRSGWPGWSPASGRWRWDPGTSLSVLRAAETWGRGVSLVALPSTATRCQQQCERWVYLEPWRSPWLRGRSPCIWGWQMFGREWI